MDERRLPCAAPPPPDETVQKQKAGGGALIKPLALNSPPLFK